MKRARRIFKPSTDSTLLHNLSANPVASSGYITRDFFRRPSTRYFNCSFVNCPFGAFSSWERVCQFCFKNTKSRKKFLIPFCSLLRQWDPWFMNIQIKIKCVLRKKQLTVRKTWFYGVYCTYETQSFFLCRITFHGMFLLSEFDAMWSVVCNLLFYKNHL